MRLLFFTMNIEGVTVLKQQIIEKIEQYDRIIILRHMRPDPDAYGSQVGLKQLIQTNYPNKEVYATGQHDELLTYLATQDEVAEEQYKGALIIITDTGNTGRIDSPYYEQGDYMIKIDHHPDVDHYGDIRWVDTTSSSSSELIFRLFKYGEQHYNWTLPNEAARLIFAGIVGDTGRFVFPSATQFTFQAASELVAYDFDRTALFDAMYEVNRDVLHLQGYIFQNFTMFENGAAYIKITKELLREYGVTTEQTSQLVGSLGNVKGIKSWVIFVEEDRLIRVRLRSKGPVINGLAAEYRGGGHPLASGASVYSWEEADEVIERLKQLCDE